MVRDCQTIVKAEKQPRDYQSKPRPSQLGSSAEKTWVQVLASGKRQCDGACLWAQHRRGRQAAGRQATQPDWQLVHITFMSLQVQGRAMKACLLQALRGWGKLGRQSFPSDCLLVGTKYPNPSVCWTPKALSAFGPILPSCTPKEPILAELCHTTIENPIYYPTTGKKSRSQDFGGFVYLLKKLFWFLIDSFMVRYMVPLWRTL